jgi:hypothetical protein
LDPLTWLNKCDNFFCSHRFPEDEKVRMASLHLDGTMTEWYYQMERDFGMVPWPRFVDFVNLRFRPPIHTNSIAEIKALVRTDTMVDYSRRFLALLNTGGLGQPLAHDVEMQHPANLHKAMSFAQAFEQRQAKASTINSLVAPKGSSRRAIASATTAAFGTTVQDGKMEGPRPRFRHLMPAEMQVLTVNNY